MRMFIGINFDKETKEKLRNIQAMLKENGAKGKFTDKDNLHLTLVFIGEVYGASFDKIKKAMDAVSVKPFRLQLNGIGSFKRDRGDILWIGVSKSKELFELHHGLTEGLALNGIEFDSKTYSPHLTIAREFIPYDSFDKISFSRKVSAIDVDVSKFSLMKSERLSGRLTYTEMYSKSLGIEK